MWNTFFEEANSQQRIGLQVFGSSAGKKRRPALLYFHDGLFNQGQIESAYDLAASLSASVLVVCVDYPLAPVMRFPDTIEVAYQALQWLALQAKSLGADPKQLFVGGERAGGNLAAVTALLYRDRGLLAPAQLKGQILINPMLDALQTSRALATLTESPCRAAWAAYAPGPSLGWHPYVSPLHSCRLAGLVPAMFINHQGCPLQEEAQSYANKLMAAGVKVQKWQVKVEEPMPSMQAMQLSPLIRQWLIPSPS